MFSIMDLIGKDPWAVERIVGEEDKSTFIKSKTLAVYIKSFYRAGGIEIIYINNMADHIIVHSKEGNLLEELICFLGVKFPPATSKNLGVVSYYQLSGLAEVTFYGDNEGGIDKIHIKAFTP